MRGYFAYEQQQREFVGVLAASVTLGVVTDADAFFYNRGSTTRNNDATLMPC
jgi:hypothetical protein